LANVKTKMSNKFNAIKKWYKVTQKQSGNKILMKVKDAVECEGGAICTEALGDMYDYKNLI